MRSRKLNDRCVEVLLLTMAEEARASGGLK